MTKETNINEISQVLSYGQKAVGMTFNPGGHEQVNAIKSKCADIIDYVNDIRNSSEDPEVKRMCSIAITDLQSAQMWAVKAATWQK
jgi:hypothetical protein